jgi:predicted Zn finger-like uncharacterized protein
MDVRCEKCLTEYELDESRLKPGGVTVKCTNCGHMFKIRKRSNTNVGAVPERPASAPPTRAQTNSSDPMSGAADGERVWMIRLETGETKTCRELATLQQWIVAGVVTRESLISRTGKTWKRLGDITELGSYFSVADEARGQRQQRASDRQGAGQKISTPPGPGTLLGVGVISANAIKGPEDIVSQPALPTPPGSGAVPIAPVAPQSARTPPMGSGMAVATAPTLVPGAFGGPGGLPTDDAPTPARPVPPVSSPPVFIAGAKVLPTTPPPVPARSATPSVGVPARPPSSSAAPPNRPMRPTPPPPPARPMPPPGALSTGAWAASEMRDVHAQAVEAQGGPQGPMSGRIKAVPGGDREFGGVVRLDGDDSFGGGDGRGMFDADSTGPVRVGAGGGMGKWIALGALGVIAAASVAIFFVLRTDDKPAVTATIDAGPTVVALTDAGSGAGTGSAGSAGSAAGTAVAPADALEAARDALYADVRARATDAELQLAGAGDDPEVLAMRARLATAVAQALEDEARLTADRGAADTLRKQKATTVLDAVKLAQRAVKAAPASVMANAAMADLLRLQGKPAKDVRRYLDAAGATGAADREIALVGAMLDLREKKPAEARAALAKLDAATGQPGSMEQTGDVRPRFQHALLLAADGKIEDAKAAVATILVAQPDHAGARALDAKLATAVATDDPMPPEQGSGAAGAGSATKPTPPTTGGGGGGGGGGEDGNFDRVLARANAAAENSCASAMPLYERALELKPNSVEALTGVGYCHLDAKQFSAAYSKFRAALMISPKYERALWGIGEMYQQQGRADKAIESYCKYLEVFEGSAAAKKQIDKLGGSCGGATAPPPDPGSGGGTAPTPTPTPEASGGGGGAGAGSAEAAPPTTP